MGNIWLHRHGNILKYINQRLNTAKRMLYNSYIMWFIRIKHDVRVVSRFFNNYSYQRIYMIK